MTEELLKKHLTTEEIINFVAFDTINEDTLALAARVNGHIRECDECRKKVSDFNDIYEELCKIYGASEARQTVYCIMEDSELILQEEKEVREALAAIKARLQ